MDCDRYREELSARMDGELTLLPAGQIDDHVEDCPACRDWAAAAVALTRRLRVREVSAGADLSGPILRAAEAARPAPVPGRAGALLRADLGLVGFGQLALGLAQLFGSAHEGMAMAPVTAVDHLFNESTAWNIAVAIGLLAAAVWPRLARGFLPALGVFVLVLTIVSITDITSRQVTAARLGTHIFLVIGLLLLFLVDRTARQPLPAGVDHARLTDDDDVVTDDDVLTRNRPTVGTSGPARRRSGGYRAGRSGRSGGHRRAA